MLDAIFDAIRSVIRDEFSRYGVADFEEVDEAPDELILLVHPACPSCKDVKEALAPLIEAGEIRLVNITSEEGTKIAEAIQEHAVPTLVARFRGGYRKCEVWFEGEDLLFDCGLAKKNE